MVIEAMIKFCEMHSQALDWELSDEKFDKSSSAANYAFNLHKCTIEKLCELGTIAAKGGGSLVTILNVSWKGVFTLLQHGSVVLSTKVNIAGIILTLISLVIEPLKCAAATWSSVVKEAVSVTEARRIFVPVKFFLINAMKISCLFPRQSYLVRKEIILCVLMISTFKVSLSNEKSLECATDTMTELLELTCLDLVKFLLNSTDLEQDMKLEIVDLLFTTERCSYPVEDPSSCYKIDPVDGLFSINCETMNGAKTFLLGRINFLLNLLRYSFDLSDDAKLLITRKLNWFLDILVQEDVYACVLVLQVPFLYFSGKTTELKWLPLFTSILHALKTFMISISSSYAWVELESLLLENLLHPHFLCLEIVMELWCFMLRYADIGLVNGVISNFFSILKLLASSESVLVYSSTLRKMARSIVMLLTYGAHSKLDEIFESFLTQEKSQLSSVMWVALILEGFPLNLLSEKLKRIAIQNIIHEYLSFIASFDETSMLASNSGVFGLPVFSASAALQSMKLSTSDIDVRTLKFLLALLRCYKISGLELKVLCRKLITETLGITSCTKHLYAFDEMEEVILELEKLFISGSTASDAQLYECKAGLAPFLAGLAHITMTETDNNAKSCAVWELYHMIFRERHWAFIHLALTAFGHFAARTSCDELWRFVPQNAALSYDLESGKQVNEEGFMLEFKTFLEKEMAFLKVTPSSEVLALLMKDGLALKDMLNKILNSCGKGMEFKSMEIDEEGQTSRKRKLPEGISKGMELLQNGLKVMRHGLSLLEESHVDFRELNKKFLSHLSDLEDEIARLGSQAGGD